MGNSSLKIGIFGGTFDPIHTAHLIIAERAREQFELDTLFFVPGYIPPHKQYKSITLTDHRVMMIRLAIEENLHFDLSSYEAVSYTHLRAHET